MIDLLRLTIPLKSSLLIEHDDETASIDWPAISQLGIRTAARDVYFENGNWKASDLTHPYESIPSSHSGLVFKIVEGNHLTWPFVELKASPAKLYQGHNVFGTNDISYCSLVLLSVFSNAYPELFSELNVDLTELKQIDVTFSARLPSQSHVSAVVDHFQGISSGQTRASSGSRFDGTAYFGSKKSQRKRLKAYDKYRETLALLKKAEREGKDTTILEQALEDARCLLRFEASLMPRFIKNHFGTTQLFKIIELVKQEQSNSQKMYDLWAIAWADILDALKGESIVMKDDKKLLTELIKLDVTTNQAKAAYATFLLIKSHGYEFTKNSLAKATFHRHKRLLLNAGLSHASMQGTAKTNVIPFIKYQELSFSDHLPAGYQLPEINDILYAA